MHARCWELFDRQPREYGASYVRTGFLRHGGFNLMYGLFLLIPFLSKP